VFKQAFVFDMQFLSKRLVTSAVSRFSVKQTQSLPTLLSRSFSGKKHA
jgi:hypothetical protein